MFCSKCGNKVNDNDKFCSKCGGKIELSKTNSILSGFQKMFETVNSVQPDVHQQYDKSKYEVFEEFFSKIMFVGQCYFVITDRSLIYENNEYPFEQLTPIQIPEGQFVLHDPKTTVNGKEIKLVIEQEAKERERFVSVAMRANQKIRLNGLKSIKEKLEYILMLQSCIGHFADHRYFINDEKWPHTLGENRIFVSNEENDKMYPELPSYFKFDESKYQELPEYEKKLVQEYMYGQELINQFYAETNILSKENREVNISHILKYLEEGDKDANAAVERYKEFKKQEAIREAIENERKRAINEARREAGLDEPSSGPGFLSRTLSTAAGVALGNRMSGGGHREKKSYYSSGPKRDLMGSASCVYGKKDSHGLTRYCPSCPVHSQCSRYHF